MPSHVTTPVELQGQSSDRKIIRVSSKRQITIPQAYYDKLGFREDAICYMDGDAIIVRPIERSGHEFADFILADLIREGYEGEALLEEFIRRQGQIRPAVERMIEDAEEYARDSANRIKPSELFED
jgi:bifunctional DNA-binding transcriptional regulator/antitoxin component of YhaV-PrlF toxin-antitoxin module